MLTLRDLCEVRFCRSACSRVDIVSVCRSAPRSRRHACRSFADLPERQIYWSAGRYMRSWKALSIRPSELVQVHRREAILEALVLRPTPFDRLFLLTPFGGMPPLSASCTQSSTSPSKWSLSSSAAERGQGRQPRHHQCGHDQRRRVGTCGGMPIAGKASSSPQHILMEIKNTGRLRHPSAAILHQAHCLKVELAAELPSPHFHSPIPLNTLSRSTKPAAGHSQPV